MSDQVLSEASRNFEVSIRVAVQLGDYMAQMRQAKLLQAQQESGARERAMRGVLNTERDLARPILERACTKAFWEVATGDDVAQAYGIAKRFQDVDPQAAITARTVEHEVLERWGIDLQTDPSVDVQEAMTTGLTPTADVLDVGQQDLPPQWGTETLDHGYGPADIPSLTGIAPHIPGDPFTADQWTLILVEAQADISPQESLAARVQGEADDAKIDAHEKQLETPGEVTPEVAALEERAYLLQGDADNEWDTLDARKDYADSVKGLAPDQAIRARVTADKGFTKPGSRSVEKVKKKTPVKRGGANQTAGRKQTLS